jgi:hypothetical protein
MDDVTPVNVIRITASWRQTSTSEYCNLDGARNTGKCYNFYGFTKAKGHQRMTCCKLPWRRDRNEHLATAITKGPTASNAATSTSRTRKGIGYQCDRLKAVTNWKGRLLVWLCIPIAFEDYSPLGCDAGSIDSYRRFVGVCCLHFQGSPKRVFLDYPEVRGTKMLKKFINN